MSYVALYRKFRPQTFEEIKGQDHVVRALKNQLMNQRIGHAYLFTGTRGTGKTSAAKIFAKAVNCLHPVNGEPCNECENCRAINAGNFVDVAEVDAASNNGVDDIRRIIDEVRYTPVKGAYKVFIIDEAHMITGPAFNAFLKTLEEPPAYAVFILATTEPHKLPITILSRCQRYDFRRIENAQITENLAEIVRAEGIEAEDKALRYIARIGDGSMRDSISLLDKCIAFNLGEMLTYDTVLDTLGTVDTEVFSRLYRSIYAGDAAAALSIVDEAVAQGRDLTQFTTDLIWYIRNLLMVEAAHLQDPDALGLSAENMEQLLKDARGADSVVLMRYIRILSEILNQIRYASGKQVLLEVGIIKLAKPAMETDTASLADRIRQLENQLAHAQVSAPLTGQPQMNSVPAQAARQIAAPPRLAALPPETGGVPAGFEEDEDDFFGGLGIGQRMTNPDAFADLLGEEPMPAYDQASAGNASMMPMGGDMLQMPTHGTAPSAPQPGPGSVQVETTDLQIWPRILELCTHPRVRAALNKCTADSEGAGMLRIIAPTAFVLKQLKDESVLSGVRDLARQAAGRDVDVQVVQAGDMPARSAGQADFPEELLQNINFNIGTEEW